MKTQKEDDDVCGDYPITITSSQSSDEVSAISSQFLIDAVKVESERRKSRLSTLRSHSEKTTRNSKGVKPKNSIMIIRTLDESLDSSNEERQNVIRNQRKRRLLKRRLSGFLKELDDSKGCSRRPQSSASIVTRESASSLSSTVSTVNFDVGFNHVTIREYLVMPGDNPSVVKGVPITIDWKHISQSTYNLDSYEDLRYSQRRVQSQMKMPPGVRSKILLDQGYSMSEIRSATKEATICRRQRVRTIEMLHNHKLEESFEALRRKFTGPFRRKNKITLQMSSGITSTNESIDSYSSQYTSGQIERRQTSNQKSTKRNRNHLSTENERDLIPSFGSMSKNEMNSSRSAKTYDMITTDDMTSSSEDCDPHPNHGMDDTKKTSNYDLELNSSRTGKLYDLTPNTENVSDFSQSKHEIVEDSNKETTGSSSQHLNVSRRGKRYDLTPPPGSHASDSNDFMSNEKLDRRDNLDRNDVSDEKNLDLLKSQDIGHSSPSHDIMCLPACGIFISICRQILGFDRVLD
eukprot:CAMPEP_0203668452 /NCGR_PEP_ID=MMETSP0090-20130426/5082_1 /ASSEMBLY_ACC=CAM_ASM_001088 /TAXON_ID=426623 /ORGANISM="Chaetoceros affinis, Strain CCMP159" /LENGTH=518 /DNA_ID=CAMNT_0050532903 /DNA_START=78 /DNA_END=1634 /DNA_ORIENTATION=-